MRRAATRFLYYAMGGGLGHVVRTMALARQMARHIGGEHWILLNSPFAKTLSTEAAREPSIRLKVLAPQATAQDAERLVATALTQFRPHVLVVDTFPRGLGGDLLSLLEGTQQPLRVLISRHLPRAYVEAYHIADFVAHQYSLVIAPGEPSPLEAWLEVHRTEPFLIRDFHELPSQRDSAARLGQPNGKVVLLVASGTPDECQSTVRLAQRLRPFWPSTLPPLTLAVPQEARVDASSVGRLPRVIRHFPLIDLLPAVAFAAGSAGYNLSWECRSLGIPALLEARRRRYDDQRMRTRRVKPLGAAEILRRAAGLESATGTKVRGFENGARTAAELIATRL